jgi:hypothetical protein
MYPVAVSPLTSPVSRSYQTLAPESAAAAQAKNMAMPMATPPKQHGDQLTFSGQTARTTNEETQPEYGFVRRFLNSVFPFLKLIPPTEAQLTSAENLKEHRESVERLAKAYKNVDSRLATYWETELSTMPKLSTLA